MVTGKTEEGQEVQVPVRWEVGQAVGDASIVGRTPEDVAFIDRVLDPSIRRPGRANVPLKRWGYRSGPDGGGFEAVYYPFVMPQAEVQCHKNVFLCRNDEVDVVIDGSTW